MLNGYAVIDVDTRGLDVNRHDRVTEMGVVQLNRPGRITEEWATLVSPLRDSVRSASTASAPPMYGKPRRSIRSRELLEPRFTGLLTDEELDMAWWRPAELNYRPTGSAS